MTTLHTNAINAISHGHHGAPFDVLGPHQDGDNVIIRAFRPTAKSLRVVTTGADATTYPMDRLSEQGFFQVSIPGNVDDLAYHFEADQHNSETITFEDVYRFPPMISEFDMYLHSEGRFLGVYEKLGAHLREVDGVSGINFAVWAPNAHRVSVVGNFNRWDPRENPMRRHGESGIWELFIPGLGVGERYKFHIKSMQQEYEGEKADPYAFATELRPATASRAGRHRCDRRVRKLCLLRFWCKNGGREGYNSGSNNTANNSADNSTADHTTDEVGGNCAKNNWNDLGHYPILQARTA